MPDLTDVTISSLVTGDLIKYNSSTSKWENFTPAYLTSESDTLDTITNRGNTTSNNLTIGDLTITGNLLVQGTTTNTNVNTLSVTNNEIIINDGTTGSPSQNGSIRIDRGTETDTVLRWNESTDKWEWTNDGTNYYNLNNYTLSVGTTLASNEATVTLTATDGTTSSYQILALGGTTLTHEPANNRITFNSVQPVNADWNSSSGLTQILNKPTSFYTLPQATTTVLGGVRVDGTSITIDPSNGQISAAPSGYTLPAATGATLGGVIIGAGLSVSNTGVLSSNVQSLPVASATVLGGIKIGSGLAIDSSTGIATVTLPTASSTVLGGVKVGNGLAIDSSGVLSTNSSAISIASPTTLGGIKNGPSINVDQTSGVTNIVPATSSQLGGVIVGSGLSITAAGILSATGGGGGGGGGTLSSRTTVSGTTILLAPGTYDTLDITGFKSYALIQINLSDAAWCRIYSSSQARTNDTGRTSGEDPDPGSGVIAEVITTGQNQAQIITPFTVGGNTESPVSDNIYLTVENLTTGNTTITATLTILQLEA